MEFRKISVNMKEDYCPGDSNEDIQNIYSMEMDSKDDFDAEKQNDYNGDLYAQLVQKENDLQLAAELGKALLEENQELSKKLEQQQDEFSTKIEEITQQKYDLKYRLENVQGEFDTTVKELQNDITQYQLELNKHKQEASASDKSRSQMVQDLTQQNERLTEQIKKQKATEEHLEGQVQSLRQQLQARRTSMTEHTHHLHVLREEVNLLTEQKNDLERKVFNLSAERDTITNNLEEAQDRIMMLERQMLEQDQQIRQKERELNTLESQNSKLTSKLDDLTYKSLHESDLSCESNENSLLNELSGITSEPSTSTPSASPSHSKFQHLSNPHPHRPHLLSPPGLPYGINCLEDDIECDDDYLSSSQNQGSAVSDSLTMQALASLWTPQREADAKIETMELKQELLEVYRSLQGLMYDLRGREEEWDPHSIQMEHVRVSAVLQVVTDLRELMEDIIKTQQSPAEKKKMEELEDKVQTLKVELSQSESHLDKVKNDLKLKDQELKHQAKELDELADKVKLSLQHDEINILRQERDRLQDQAMGMSPDQVLQETRKERDEAIERKQELERQLVQARVDIVSLDAQLMDAIQQKLDLSQQLELWQVDMQELIGSTVVTRLQQEKKPAAAKQPSPQPPKRKLKFSFPWN